MKEVSELLDFRGTLAELIKKVQHCADRYGESAECAIEGEYYFGESAGLRIQCKTISLAQCREVAARLWCDADYSSVVTDTELCELIAQKLYAHAKQ